jgi:aspartate/methionine/tyrosine aminotransferase
VKFSRRAQWNAPTNRLTIARRARRDLLDLTESNPTRAGIAYPLDAMSEVMSRAARTPYDPQPLGLRSAREAVAEHLGCDADDVIITASTSEAYSFLFKLLADPGDSIGIFTPSYPLFEHLAQLELITLKSSPLEFHRRWEIASVPESVRAIVVVNPNNPTGSFVTPEENSALERLGVPIISDEVFIDYVLSGAPATLPANVLHFTLGGLSKSLGLPHYKLGWIRVSGPGKREAIDALELIADNFLSVATPVQVALPELLKLNIRASIQQRIEANLDTLRRVIASKPHAQLLPVEGGWSAVIRMPQLGSDEDFALNAIEQHGVVVHPGYFFDFDRDGYFVVSLLTDPQTLNEGILRIV